MGLAARKDERDVMGRWSVGGLMEASFQPCRRYLGAPTNTSITELAAVNCTEESPP